MQSNIGKLRNLNREIINIQEVTYYEHKQEENTR